MSMKEEVTVPRKSISDKIWLGAMILSFALIRMLTKKETTKSENSVTTINPVTPANIMPAQAESNSILLNSAESEVSKLGKMEGSLYWNDYFGIATTIPRNWVAMSALEVGQRRADGTSFIKKNGLASMNNANSANQVLHLLDIRPKDDQGWTSIPSFSIWAEPANHRTSLEYLQNVEKIFSKQTSISIKFGKPYMLICKGGDLVAIDCESSYEQQQAYTTYAIMESEGYLITFATKSGDLGTAGKLKTVVANVIIKR